MDKQKLYDALKQILVSNPVCEKRGICYNASSNLGLTEGPDRLHLALYTQFGEYFKRLGLHYCSPLSKSDALHDTYSKPWNNPERWHLVSQLMELIGTDIEDEPKLVRATDELDFSVEFMSVACLMGGAEGVELGALCGGWQL